MATTEPHQENDEDVGVDIDELNDIAAGASRVLAGVEEMDEDEVDEVLEAAAMEEDDDVDVADVADSELFDIDPPEEVRGDLLEQLESMDRAASFAGTGHGVGLTRGAAVSDPLAFDPTMGLSPAPEGSGRSWSADPFGGTGTRQANELEVPENIEDLYARYPKLLTGEWFLRVERDKPKTFRNKPCDGYLSDVYEPLDMPKFRAMFGGGQYTLSVMGPKGESIAEDGTRQVRTVSRLRINISGEPRFLGEDQEEHMFGRNGGPSPRYFGDPTVERTKIEFAHKREEREDERQERLHAELAEKDRQRFEALERANREKLDTVQEMSNQALTMAHAQVDRLEAQLREAHRELRDLRDDRDKQVSSLNNMLVQVRQEHAAAYNKEENERIREIKERHERELKQQATAHSEKLEDLIQRQRDREADLTDRAEKERRDINERAERDHRFLVEEHRRTLENAHNEHQRQITAMRESYESRLNEASRHSDREIKGLRESHALQLESIRTSERAVAGAETSSARQQLEWLQMQMASLRDDLARKDSALEQLRTEMFSSQKSPIEQITEAKSLLDQLGIGGQKEPEDFKTAAVQLMRNVGDNLPQVFEQLSAARGQAQAQAAQAQAVQAESRRQQEAELRAAQMRRNSMLQRQGALPQPLGVDGGVNQPPPPRVRHQPPPGMVYEEGFDVGDGFSGQRVAAPLGHSGSPDAGGAAPLHGVAESPLPYYTDSLEPNYPEPTYPVQQQAPEHQPHQPQAHHQPSPQQPRPQAVQHQPRATSGAENRRPLPPPTSPVPLGPPPPPEPEAEVAEETREPAVELDPEAVAKVEEFVGALNSAIDGGVIGPKMFARGFVDQVGAEVASQIVTQMTADAFVDEIARAMADRDLAIVTVDGREYVKTAWQEVTRLTSGA